MKLFIVLGLLFLLGYSSVEAQAEKSEVVNPSAILISNTQCGPTLMTRVELEGMGERLVASAIMKVASDDAVIIAIFSNDSGEWSIMIDGENGISCMIMWGSRWSMVE